MGDTNCTFTKGEGAYVIEGEEQYSLDVTEVPRKGGPGITQSDLLIINKTDLAEAVGADLGVMDRDAKRMRGDGPTIFTQCKHHVGIDKVCALILKSWAAQTGKKIKE
ncbi:hypothetical protein SARC_08300 [Sphaeroforma arctica JP610]|uniref:CobW/HypB/UreG nucleotide-binding domain-containing protein n=1 Tax=Sphaeroforma arctica JP610 TaxID=667725 RepID=A0A0L0FRA3_9EUKA|nr:hypothetical protein SARC_08300 [Sphaeroforma arctica JP610]KNC79305.1 hypothetical protein SARC_08300 [Sphaeroforma arctica JP610]|eukprot:XP_014153207.1 hypothetical protein SARC_08300 [Sphaeroforma arctica JP610]